MSKNILILKTTRDICGNEVNLIKNHCELLKMNVYEEQIGSEQELTEIVTSYSAKNIKLDYLYLCTHGNSKSFIHNIEVKSAEPSYAAEKASKATDYTFVCYDRDEIEMNPQYENRKYQIHLELGWITEDGQWIEEDEKIKENVGV